VHSRGLPANTKKGPGRKSPFTPTLEEEKKDIGGTKLQQEGRGGIATEGRGDISEEFVVRFVRHPRTE